MPCFFTNLLLSTFYLVSRLHLPLEIHRLFWRLPRMEVVAITLSRKEQYVAQEYLSKLVLLTPTLALNPAP